MWNLFETEVLVCPSFPVLHRRRISILLHTGKISPFRARKSYWRRRGVTPFILIQPQMWVLSFTPPAALYRERIPIPTEQQAMRAPEPVRNFGEEKNFLPLPGFETRPAITIMTAPVSSEEHNICLLCWCLTPWQWRNGNLRFFICSYNIAMFAKHNLLIIP